MIRSKRFLLAVLTVLSFLLLLSVRPIKSIDNNEANQLMLKIQASEEKLINVGSSLNRLYRILQSFEKDSKSINLDGLYGIRIAEGIMIQLDKTEQFAGLNTESNKRIKQTINILKKRIHSLAESIVSNVKDQSLEYYTKFGSLVNKPYFQEPLLRNHENNFKVFSNKTVFDNKSFNEKFSDYCMSLLLNTENKHDQKCKTTSQCFNVILRENSTDYSLTHQLLYFMVAEHIGCSSSVMKDLIRHIKRFKLDKLVSEIFYSENLKNSIDDKQEINVFRSGLFSYYCSRVYHESSKLYSESENLSRFPIDLFIEQNVLCGLLGMEKFYNNRFYGLISSFQPTTGCFGGDLNVYGKLEELKPLDEIMLEINKTAANQTTESHKPVHKIVKRYDMVMNDDCSSHESGLALAYYSINLDVNLKSIESF